MVTNEEAKRCPLCAEEMDLTDQQLKPCKCGYQVCVWCWHQIMDMAEKDGTEGRCPACRTHYDKDKIVGMEANFERVVANANRKHKPPKAKSKANEGKKDLSIVRVIQRKMAYVIGLPLSLADEDLLKRKDFFGQYGKICKISLSRTAGGALQQFVNDSCSVYITFSKEEEAVRCIQSVHGFVLEGRFLRASFGTAKYCHAWLRNVPCNNSVCLYLHSLGAEEDSFGKDEVAAVHTRSRVQQIVGATHNLHRRSGNVLPPPVDGPFNYNSASTEKPVLKCGVKDIPGEMETCSGHLDYLDPSKDKDEYVGLPNKGTSFVDIIVRPSSSSREKDGNVAEDRRAAIICSELSSVELHKDNNVEAAHSDAKLHARQFASKKDLKGPSSESSDIWNLGRNEGSLSGACVSENFGTQLHSGEQTIHAPCNTVKDDGLKESGSLTQEVPLRPPSYPLKTSQYSSNHVRQHGPSCNASVYSANLNTVHNNIDENLALKNANWNGDGYNENKFQSSAKSDMIYRSSKSFSNEEIVEHLRRLDNDERIHDAQSPQSPSLEAVERSIISNIMSLGLDAADDLSTLHPSVAGLCNHTDMRHGSLLNLYNNDQSMFSFGNREAFVDQRTGIESSFHDGGQDSLKFALPQNLGERKDSYYSSSSAEVSTRPGYTLPSRAPPPGFSACEITDHVFHANSGNTMVNANLYLNNHYRTPSSGNSSNTSDVDLIDQTIMSLSRGNPPNGLSNSYFDTRPNYASQSSAVDDDARAWLLNLLMQQSTAKTQNLKYAQTYGQQAPAAHQVQRYYGQAGDGYSSWNDIYGASLTHTGHVQQSDTSSYTLSQQKLENGMYSNNYQPPVDGMQLRNELGMVETKRDEKLGFNKFYTGHGDYISQPSSDDQYTRVFGI